MKSLRLIDVSRFCGWTLLIALLIGLSGCGQEVPKPVAQKSDSDKSGSETKSQSKGKSGKKNPAASGETKRIIFITNGDAPFWDACNAGMSDAARKFKLKEAGYEAVFVRNDGKERGQIDKLRQYGTQGDIAAIAISVISPKNAALADEMKKLMAKGIKVITIDSDLDRKLHRDARTYYIGTDNFKGGQLLGICTKQLRPNGGEFATFVGYKGAQNAIDRITGFIDGAGEKFKSVNSLEDGLEFKKAVENVRTELVNHPTINTIVGIYAYNGPAAVEVVRPQNARSKYVVVTFDADPRSVKLMGDGMIDAMVVQDPYHMGYHGVRILKAMLDEDDAAIEAIRTELPSASGEKDIFDTALKVVVPDAKSPVKKDIFPKGVIFQTLPEFKKWLEEYGLTGS